MLITVRAGCRSDRNTLLLVSARVISKPCNVSAYLEKFGMQEQRVGSFCIVITFFVQVTQFVQVPESNKSIPSSNGWLSNVTN